MSFRGTQYVFDGPFTRCLARMSCPGAEPHAGNSLINGRAGALASRWHCPEHCPGTGASCAGTAMTTGLLMSHVDEGPLIDLFHQSCPRDARQSFLHLDSGATVGAGGAGGCREADKTRQTNFRLKNTESVQIGLPG